jgi:hypothetical protein
MRRLRCLVTPGTKCLRVAAEKVGLQENADFFLWKHRYGSVYGRARVLKFCEIVGG